MRKTTTSTDVKARYNEKTYRRILVNLRYDDDDVILQHIDCMTFSGMSASDAIKKLLYSAIRDSQE